MPDRLLLEQQTPGTTVAGDFIPAPWASPQGVWSVLVAGPTEEPITLAEAKLRAGLDWIDGDPRDAMIEDFIRAARAQVEQDTGLALLTQTRDVYFADMIGPVPLPSQTQPTQSVELLTPTPAAALPVPRRYQPGVRNSLLATGGPMTYRVVAGWLTAAALRQEAPSLYHAVALLTAHYATAGRDLVAGSSDGLAQVPFGYEHAIAAHRLVFVI